MNNKLWKKARNFWLFFLDLIFPVECLSCGAEGRWLCRECLEKIKIQPWQYCLACKKKNVLGEFCPDCRAGYSLDGVWIVSSYDDPTINQAIKKFKYNFIQDLAQAFGQLLVSFADSFIKNNKITAIDLSRGVGWDVFRQAKKLPAVILDFQNNLVVPVPLAGRRLRWRGFNQAEIIARLFAGHYDLKVNSRDLVRLRHKKPQAKLPEAERLKNIKNCFVWRGIDLDNKNIILIDDVVTTGATLNECARILKVAGAGEVWGLTVAKG